MPGRAGGKDFWDEAKAVSFQLTHSYPFPILLLKKAVLLLQAAKEAQA